MRKHQDLAVIRLIKSDWLLFKKRPYVMLLVGLALVLIYVIVYSTGGIKYVYSHSMYIPIIFAGIYLGATFGAFTGVIAGILLGPLMPLDTITGEMQETFNWIYRLIIFVVVGLIIGIASNKLRKDAVHIIDLMSINQETNIPNTNYLKDKHLNFKEITYSIYTVLIGNHHSIIDLFGSSIYHTFIHEIYKDLMQDLPEKSLVIQSDSNKLWILIPNDQLSLNIDLIIKTINKPKQIKNIPMYADFSIGGSLSNGDDNHDLLSIFENSDMSARHAQLRNVPYIIGGLDKMQKKNEYELVATFSKALQEMQTYLVFQPKIDLKTNKPMGLEALIRWEHPKRGNIPPDQFIHLIEETKLIHQLTDWVLIQALNQQRELMKYDCNLPISVNISGKNLYDPQFYDRTVKLIQDSNVPYELLEFELTESVLMINPQESKQILNKFVNLGIKISLDDFGSGYSSLAYLAQFPIHYIKIDRFFLKDILVNSHMLEIVKSTIKLSKNLGYQVVAEGAESTEVIDLIKSFDCDIAQGYYYTKPLKANDLETWFKVYYKKLDEK